MSLLGHVRFEQLSTLTGVDVLRQTYVSLERGTSKSRHCNVVRGGQPISIREIEITMKARQRENNFRNRIRNLFRPRASGHDPLLVVNMSIFNFTDGWSRTFS